MAISKAALEVRRGEAARLEAAAAAAAARQLEEVEAEFDSIAETIQPDREERITAVQVLEWCKRHQYQLQSW